MPKNLVIVESPAKAKTIGKYLGKEFHVEASAGHVRDLPAKKLGVDIENDFQPTYELLKGREKIVGKIRKAASTATAVYLATDLDREGEAIAWHLCEALGLSPKDVHRVVFSEITKPAITEAFAHPGRINMDKVSAQEARRILDRLVGYKLSPLLWKKVARGLSAGRVQSVAVRILVEREREIRAFRPEEYWTITAILSRRGQEATFKAALAEINGEKFRPASKAATRPVGDLMRRAAYHVLSSATKRVAEKPPAPFITSHLQAAAAQQLRFSAKKTMTLAQQLYQGVELGPEGMVALITYMRTDSHHVAPAAQAAARELIEKTYGKQYLPDQPPVYASRARAQKAHEAIRPTEVTRTPESVKPFLDPDDARLYELIWKRFVASQMKPALWDVTETDIEAVAGATKGLFKARGRVLVYDGHTVVTGVRLAENEQQLPALAEGEPLDLKGLEEVQHFTQPPPRYNEATLIRKLESEGIGRPSTYATIISTIQDRGYVQQKTNLFLRCQGYPECQYTVPCDIEGKPMAAELVNGDGKCQSCHSPMEPKEGKRCFYATDLGEVVTDKLVGHFPKIMDVAFTSHMEEELDEVEEAKMAWLSVVREFWGPFSEALARASENMEATKDQPVEEAGPCPQCGAPLVKRFSKRGAFLGCSKYPDCTYTRPLNGEARPEPKRTEHLCEKCGGTLLLRYNQRNEPFFGCENYPKCKKTMPCDAEGHPVKPQATGIACDKCGSPMVIKTSRRGPFFGCSAYPKCRYTLPCDENGNPVRPVPTGEVCDKCGSPMVIKTSRRGPFLACSAYPKCRNAKSLKKAGLGTEKSRPTEATKPARPRAAMPRRPKATPTDRLCPDCGSPLLIRSGRRGPFLGCSKYPDCRHTEDLPDDLKQPASAQGD